MASVYNRAMRAGMIESAVILGSTFDRAELPSSHGLYEATRGEWDRAKADAAAG